MKGTKMKTFTRDDFEIVYGETPWGAPSAALTLSSELADRFTRYHKTFVLNSTKGHARLPDSDKPGDGRGIVVWAGGNGVKWLGNYEHFDIERAIDELLAWLTAESIKDDFSDEWNLLNSAEEAFRHFHESLEWGSRRNYLEEWGRVREAVTAIEVRLSKDLSPADAEDGIVLYRVGKQ